MDLVKSFAYCLICWPKNCEFSLKIQWCHFSKCLWWMSVSVSELEHVDTVLLLYYLIVCRELFIHLEAYTAKWWVWLRCGVGLAVTSSFTFFLFTMFMESSTSSWRLSCVEPAASCCHILMHTRQVSIVIFLYRSLTWVVFVFVLTFNQLHANII